MISFFDKTIEKENFKVWLYSPGGAFLGELVVDNPVLNIQLEGFMSTFEFDIVENIERASNINYNATLQRNEVIELSSTVNPRLNETLDQFQVEVWYGDLATDSYQKQRFIIIDTPNSFGNDITKFHFKAYSREYENKFIRIIDWPGVLIREFKDIKNIDAIANTEQEATFNLAQRPKDADLIRVEIVKDFVYRLPGLNAQPGSFTFSVGAKQSTIKIYAKIDDEWTLLEKDADYELDVDSVTEDLLINYQFGSDLTLGVYDPSNLIPIYIDYKLENPLTQQLTRIDSAPRTSIFDFYYDATVGTDGSIVCYVPRIPLLFSKDTAQTYDNVIPADTKIQIVIYYETEASVSEDLINQYTTKDGLAINQVMSSLFNNTGDEDNTDARWSAVFHSALIGQTRSGFNFNNTNLFAAINETLKAFNAIAIPDTVNKVFYVYDKDTAGQITENNVVVSQYRQETGLSIEYGKYLKDVGQSISTEDIVTIIRGLGADNITAAIATPTGYNEWEDYTYYLDGAQIANYDDLISKTPIVPELTKSSRWMTDRLTTKLLLWMKAREGVENQLYQQMPDQSFTQPLMINSETGTVELEGTLNPFDTFSIPLLVAQKKLLSSDYIVETLNDIAGIDGLGVGDIVSVRNDINYSNNWSIYRITGLDPITRTLEDTQSTIVAQYPDWTGTSNWGFMQVFDELERQLIQIAEYKVVANTDLSKWKTILQLLTNTDSASLAHLENWKDKEINPNYTGIDGYKQYTELNVKQFENKVNALDEVEALWRQYLIWIQYYLQDLYLLIRKQNFTDLFVDNSGNSLSNFQGYDFEEEDFVELNGFRREGLYENKFITKPSELFLEMKKEIESLRSPRVQVSANIIGILQAMDTRVDWNSLILGGLANLVVARLNIDLKIQIKTINIAVDSNTTSFTFSTEKNFIGTGQKFLGRFFANATYNLTNNLGYREGQWTQAVLNADNANTLLTNGFSIDSGNPVATSTVIIDDQGISTDGFTVDPQTDQLVSARSNVGRILTFGFVRINAGRIDVERRDASNNLINSLVIEPEGLEQTSVLSPALSSIVRMDNEGFSIVRDNNGTETKQFYVDTNGNIIFAGTISQVVYEDLNIPIVSITADTFTIKLDKDGLNPTPSSITLTASLAAGFTAFNWQYFNGSAWVDFGNTTSSISITSSNAAWGSATSLLVRCVTNDDVVNTVTLYKIQDGQDGEKGDPGQTIVGPPGPTGPGVVYRGEWDSSTEYYRTSSRRDIVIYNGSYYICVFTHIGVTPGTNVARWTTFGAEFSSVATDILFAQDVYANQTINIGSDGVNPVIALNADTANNNANPYISINKLSYNDTASGIFLGFDGGTAKVNIGDSTKNVKWNGSDLTIGNFTITATETDPLLGPLLQGSLKASSGVYSSSVSANAIKLSDNTATSGISGKQIRLTGQDGIQIYTIRPFGAPPYGVALNSDDVSGFISDIYGNGDVRIPKDGTNREIPGATISGTTLTIYLE